VSKIITISATASDNVGVTKVEFYRDGSTLVGTDTTASYSMSFDTTTLANGSHSFSAKAYDAAGNATTSASVSVTVNNTTADTTPPSVTLSSPVNGSTVSNTITPLATASDNVGVAKVEFYRDGTNLFATVQNASLSANFSASTTFVTTTISNGSHTFSAKAYDVAGNVTTSAINTVTVNNGAVVSPPGQIQWVATGGGTTFNDAIPRSIAADSSGNIVAVGQFSGTVNFGTGPISSTAGNANIFIAKYNSNGALVWLKTLGSTGPAYLNNSEYAYGVAIDSQNNIIVTGQFQGTVDFSGTGAPGASLTNNAPVIFVAKYNSSGVVSFVKKFGVSNNNVGYAVATATNDDIFLAGAIQSTIDFGNGFVLTSAGYDDVVLARLDHTDGHTVWAERWGSSNYDDPTSLAVDKNNNIWVTGTFNAQPDFGGGLETNVFGFFVAKYSGANGSWLFDRTTGGTGSAYGVATDPTTGNAVVTGSFVTPMDFGGGLVSPGVGQTLFLAAYDPSGRTNLWLRTWGGDISGSPDRGIGVKISANGVLALTGNFGSYMEFGVYPQNPPVSGFGYFVAEFTLSGNSPPVYQWAKRSSSSNSSSYGVAFSPLGTVATCGYFQGSTDFGGMVAGAGMIGSFVANYTSK
jgi:hypothetical protein